MVAVADLTSQQVKTYLRHRTGLSGSDRAGEWYVRLLRSKWTWAGTAWVVACLGSSWILWTYMMASATAEDGTEIPGLNPDALWLSASRALPTMLFWIVCFILVDRYKPQRLLVWVMALGWGGSVAPFASAFINSWADAHMAVYNDMTGVSSLRTAVFIAPFVEEAMKGSAVFLIAILDRNRFTSRVSGAVVGGLVAAGFAFSENIVYYARAIVYGARTSGVGDVMGFLDNMVMLRGVLTCFGHPLFTMMTGIGIAFAVAARSKTIRVLAPAAGFMFAAFLHMSFNWWLSVLSNYMWPVLMVGWVIVGTVAIRLIIAMFRQGRTIAVRLGDYVSMGWMPANYPVAFSKLRHRAWTLMMSPWHGNVIRTWRLQVRATRLAMLREAITRGTIDHAGLWEERELIESIADLASRSGLADGRGLRPYWPWRNWFRRRQEAPKQVLKYSGVNPQWGPPA